MADLTQEQLDYWMAVAAAWGVSVDQINAWFTTGANDGPGNDGRVPFTNRGGVTVMVPCLAKVMTMFPTGQPVEQVYRIFGGPSIVYAGEHEDIRAPFSMMVTRIWISLTAPDGAAIGAVGLRANVNVDGVPMLSTPLTVPPGQLLSTASGDGAPVIANSIILEKARLTFPVLMTGGGAKGLTYMIGGYRL